MKILYYILLGGYLCISLDSYSQDYENTTLASQEDIRQNFVSSLLRKGDSLVRVKNYTLAEDHYVKAFDLAKKYEVKKDITTTGFRLAHFLSATQEKHTEGEEVIRFLASYCDQEQDEVCEIRTSILLSNIKVRKLEFIDALKSINKAIAQLERTDHKNLHWQALTARGFLLLNIGDATSSKKDFKHALNFITSETSIANRSISYINISASFVDTQPDSILYYSRLAARYCKDDLTSRHCNLANNNIAWAYFLKGMPKQALDIVENFIDLEKIEYDQGDSLYGALMHTLGSIYYELGDYAKAVDYFEIADTYYLKVKDLSYAIVVKEDLSKAYESQGNYKEGMHVLKEIKPLISKLDSLKITREIAKIESKKLLDVKEAKIINLEQENIEIEEKIYKTRTFSYVLGVCLILGISFFLYKGHKNKVKFHQLNEELSLNRLKSLRSMMNPHFLFNSFSTLQNYILKKENLKANEYMTEFSGLIRNILSSSDSMYIRFVDELEILQSYIKIEQERFNHLFDVSYRIDEELYNTNPKIPSMIVQPYVENAIIHGFSHSKRHGLLTVSFSKKEQSIICKVTDNGIGREQAEEIKLQGNDHGHLSIASRNTDERLRILDKINDQPASVTIHDLFDESGDSRGTEVVIHLPILNSKVEI